MLTIVSHRAPVIDEFYPSTLLSIVYPSGKDVVLGNQLTMVDTAQVPEVTFISDDPNATYTLVMVGLVCERVREGFPSTSEFRPTNQQFGQWRHWVVTNISGAAPSIASAEQHTPYIGPGPGPDTGVHRYLFLLYKQTRGITQFRVMPHEKPHRRYFKAREFAAENGLELVSANFFLCENKA
ncbi:phosphatidylethanolamine-binding protein [Jimgerdemannia flammicorona]|uniref:Phosphatidylethanolamine-binding protein n=2 Tax=Jimgerdemannia flammicorona TaxID=994334 RepID=A0A433QK68_9FUNG|nr:phosphatidylethanolamine-binding protein [Jimgerdemannia flammicorona]RUS30156.1 phosphatidylethanolamine-binding protein [Jimgerdemannia flammicorona]